MSYTAEIARSIKRYEDSDKPQLRAFQAEYFGAASRQCDDRYFEWLFEKNPNRGAEGPELWIARRDGEIVAQQASIPVVLKADERELRAAWGIDLMVRSEWRLKGVAPVLNAVFEESADVLLGAALSEPAHKAFMRRGWSDLGKMTIWARPLDSAKCLQEFGVPAYLARLVPSLVTKGTAVAAGRVVGALARARLEPVAAFDERVDALWTLSSPDYRLLVKRDYAYLRWRFDETPCRENYRRYYLERKGTLVGYAVVLVEPWRGAKAARIVDYLAPRRWLRPLLARVIETVSAHGVAAVSVENLHAAGDPVLRSLGCMRMPAVTRFIMRAGERASPLRDTMGSMGNWYLSVGDSDLDHESCYLQTQRSLSA